MGVVRKKVPGEWAWDGAEVVRYDGNTVRGVSKRVLIGPKDGAEGFSMRYFEVQPGGNSAFEHHPHIHQVFIVNGRGRALVGDTYHEVGPGDVVYVGPDEQHVFEASPDEALGFICIAPNH